MSFNVETSIVVTGAELSIELNGEPQSPWQVISVQAGDKLKLGQVKGTGARAYLLVAGGIQCPEYLGSRSTFTLGQFGGHVGRTLKTGDVLHILPEQQVSDNVVMAASLHPEIEHHLDIHVVYGATWCTRLFH